MPEPDLALLIDAVEAAGKIALTYHRKDPKTWDKGNGQGPVTEADLAVDAMLKERLLSARPDYGWLSEETEDSTHRLSTERIFIVDPIDGTRAFVSGGASFSHVAALAENGRIVAAAVHLPVLGRTYAAATGQGAVLNGSRLTTSSRQDVEAAEILTAKTNLKPEHWNGGTPPVKPSFRPSLAYRMCLVAEGRFDGMLTFRDAWEWDVAAGVLIIEEAGGLATGGRGEALFFNNQIPQVPGILAGTPKVHAGLLARRQGIR